MEKKEAIKILKDFHDESALFSIRTALETLVPELKESEDEKIRKALIENFELLNGKQFKNQKWGAHEELLIDDILSWLEKQGEIDMKSYKETEDEKHEFVGDGFIKCYADFQDFKEGETYWLEYVGNDNYNVRSDNLLGKTYHITPCQLYTIFKKMTWLEKQEYEQKNKINSYKITFEDVLVLECAMKTIKITEGGNKLYEKLVPFYDKIHNAYLLEKQGEQKVSYTTIVETGNGGINALVTRELSTNGCDYEQKNADKVEPKFKVGDWITNGNYTWKIVEVKPLDYILQSQDGNVVDDTISHVDEQFHSFTIEDAKDSDVIACENGRISIFKCLNDNLFSSYCFIDNKGWFCGDEGQVHMLDTIICGEIYPATNEQRDTLMKAMADAGYTFDFDKRELKKIEQKSTWSEEDEKIFNKIIRKLDESDNVNHYDYTDFEMWLIDLKERLINI